MEIGAFFILVIVVVVVGIFGGIVYAIAAKRRHQELAPDTSGPTGEQPRPTHHAVENEQNTEFVGTR
jgi:heme/copper-type cytochrome/quinol oxidase subunit 2